MLHDAQGPFLTLLLPWNVADYAVLSPVILYWQSKLCRMQHAQRETRCGATWCDMGRDGARLPSQCYRIFYFQ